MAELEAKVAELEGRPSLQAYTATMERLAELEKARAVQQVCECTVEGRGREQPSRCESASSRCHCV